MHESTGSESVGEVVEEPVRSAADLGRAIRARRRGQGLNQEQLALLADSHRNRVASSGVVRPSGCSCCGGCSTSSGWS